MTSKFSHSVQRDIADFHREVVGIADSDTPMIRRPELRAELIREEAKETVDAILAGDLVEAIDGLCDLLAVVYGAAAEFGIDLAPFWDEVHRSNMAKAGGPLREDGKRLKPLGWMSPDIAGVLAGHLMPEPCATCGRLLADVERLRGLVYELRRFLPYEKPEQQSLPGWIVDIAERSRAEIEGEPNAAR